jgi:hypothetical protein
MTSRIIVALKYIGQFGIRPLALFALYKFGLKTGHYKRAESRRVDTSHLVPTHLFPLPSHEQLIRTLGDEGKMSLLKEADEIVAGNFHMFGGEHVPLQLTFDQPLQHWTAYETDHQLLSTLNSQISDIKFLWEPARFGWAFVLGRAYHITQDNKYADAFWKYFESFTADNPAYLGPHWMNGQEVALRLMAYVWGREVFETAPASSAERSAALLQSITDHASRITQTLVYARSQNNNHLVNEAAAIYSAGVLLKNPQWRALGWRWLNWAFQNQIGGYGEYIQHSANYHRVMLQTALWVNLIKDDDWPRATLQALGRATHWLFSLLDLASGRTPNLGANDGALIFPLSSTPFNDYRPVVQAAARAFIKTQIEPGIWDEMPLWFGLAPAGKTYEPEHYLSDNLRGRESWAYLRASTFKSRLSHMDQLHLDLWWRGLNIAQDAGTYLYNAAPPWDNLLVSTRVHNTVMVDGRDQMTRGGRFLMLDWFPAYSKSEIAAEEDVLQRIKANHTGYCGIKHERTVTVYANEKWLIEDKLTRRRTASHVYRLHWLLPDWEWKLENREPGIAISLLSPYGWMTISLQTQPALSDARLPVSLVRAGEVVYGERDVRPYEGWVSPTYGVKVPALSLAFEVTSLWNVTFITEFVFPK